LLELIGHAFTSTLFKIFLDSFMSCRRERQMVGIDIFAKSENVKDKFLCSSSM
jgi:hypothetical protein